MGGKNDKKAYEIPLNTELNDDIKKTINIIENPNEIEKFQRLIHKNVKNNIKRSYFRENFEDKDKAINNITSLINLIYTKRTNKYLKDKGNMTLYETIFNYDIVENQGERYNQFTKNIVNTMKIFISGEKENNIEKPNNDISNDNNNGIFETLTLSIKNQSINSEKSETLRGQNNMNSLRTKKSNPYQNSIKNSINSIRNSHNSTIDKNNYIINGNNNINSSNQLINLNPSFKNPNFNENNLNIKTENSIESINYKSNLREGIIQIPKSNKKSRSISKKKHNQNPKKKPLVNIILDIRDLYKQDRMEKNTEKLVNYKSRSPKNSYFRKDNIKNSINENEETFLDKIDRYSQPNKLKNEIIHSEICKRNTKGIFKVSPNNNNVTYKMNATKKIK